MKVRELAATSAAVTTCAVVGGIGTDPESLYYRLLRKTDVAAAQLAFPIVWTALYADIAGTTGQALGELADDEPRSAEYRGLAVALGVNLSLNTLWSWLFFRWHRRWLATVECAVLTASSVDPARRVHAVDRRAGRILAPYPAWCAFATVLSASIARLNRGRGTA